MLLSNFIRKTFQVAGKWPVMRLILCQFDCFLAKLQFFPCIKPQTKCQTCLLDVAIMLLQEWCLQLRTMVSNSCVKLLLSPWKVGVGTLLARVSSLFATMGLKLEDLAMCITLFCTVISTIRLILRRLSLFRWILIEFWLRVWYFVHVGVQSVPFWQLELPTPLWKPELWLQFSNRESS